MDLCMYTLNSHSKTNSEWKLESSEWDWLITWGKGYTGHKSNFPSSRSSDYFVFNEVIIDNKSKSRAIA